MQYLKTQINFYLYQGFNWWSKVVIGGTLLGIGILLMMHALILTLITLGA